MRHSNKFDTRPIYPAILPRKSKLTKPGTLLVTREGSYFGRIPKTKIKSTVGAGDSMVGATMFQIFKGNFSGADLLRWGLAGSTATLSQPGTTLGSKAEIHRFYKLVKVRLLR